MPTKIQAIHDFALSGRGLGAFSALRVGGFFFAPDAEFPRWR
jgi:hypothetical protein